MGRGAAFSHDQPGVPSVWHQADRSRCEARLDEEDKLTADWLVRLTDNQRKRAFGLCFLYLRNTEQSRWNRKRVYMIYRERQLNRRIKPRHRPVRGKPLPVAVPTAINQSWSIDFMHDELAAGRSIRLSHELISP